MYPKAIAIIYGGIDYPQLSGTVRFFLGIDGVIVEVEVKGFLKQKVVSSDSIFMRVVAAPEKALQIQEVITIRKRISTRSTQEICHRYCLMMGKLI